MKFSSPIPLLALATLTSGTASHPFPLPLSLPFLTHNSQNPAFTFTRLDKTNAALLVVDHQLGLSELVRDYDPTVFRQSVFAHAALGKLFNLPTILTTSAETGPNGALPKEVL